MQRLPGGEWQAALLVGEPVASEQEAHELALFICRHADRRMPDVGAQLDAATVAVPPAAVPVQAAPATTTAAVAVASPAFSDA